MSRYQVNSLHFEGMLEYTLIYKLIPTIGTEREIFAPRDIERFGFDGIGTESVGIFLLDRRRFRGNFVTFDAFEVRRKRKLWEKVC